MSGTMGTMPLLGQEAQLGLGGASDPYLLNLMRERALAEALMQRQQRQPMTHWLQPVAEAVDKGMAGWRMKKATQDMLDYQKTQQDKASALARSVLDRLGLGGPMRGQEASPTPPAPATGPAAAAPAPIGASGAGEGASYGGISVPATYAPHIAEAAKAYNVPAPLLAWVGNRESNFNGRPGMTDPRDGQTPDGAWQFKPQTAAQYGLNSPADIQDPAKSTHAAAGYLADLYKQTGNWADAVGRYGTFSPRPGETSDAIRQQFIEFAKQYADPETGVGTPVEAAYAPQPMPGGATPPSAGQAPAAAPVAPQMASAVPQGMPPGQPQMTQGQRMKLAAALLQMQGGGSRYLAPIAQGLTTMAGAFPDPKYQTVAPGGTVLDPATGRVVYSAPPLPDWKPYSADGQTGVYNARNPQERRQFGLNTSPVPGLMPRETFQQQVDLNNAKRPNTVINTGGNKMMEGAVADFRAAQEAASAAASRNVLYNRLDKAITAFPPGKDFPLRLWGGQMLAAAGIKSDNLSEGEIGNMIASRLAIQAAPKGQGQVSNYERSLFAAALPQMTTTLAGTRQAIKLMRSLDAMDVEAAKIYRENARRNNGIPDAVSVAEELAQLQERMGGKIRDALAPFGGEGGPVKVSSPDEAAKLPPGTEFVTPDGRRMRVPGGAQ